MNKEAKPNKGIIFDVNDICADFDEDCDDVCNKEACYEHDNTAGKCPYLCGHPEFQMEGNK